MNLRADFLQHLAQTSPAPVGLHITRAEGSYLYDESGKSYLDLIGGISVCNLGHGNARIREAIKAQADQYLHIMVYGELLQTPQIEYAKLLAGTLPPELDCIYFTNSGSEATEGAIKLARRITGRTAMISCRNSYHGSTTGALSLMGSEYWRHPFEPLLPGVTQHHYNSEELIRAIDGSQSCVVLETVQAEAGVIRPDGDWLQRVRQRCDETATLLVLDEIQCGCGRTGTFWGFEQYGVQPDILLAGKALGGGMPLGAFIAARRQMQLLSDNPVLGHITTFGGHPVSCAAGLAAARELLEKGIAASVKQKEQRFLDKLRHPAIRAVRSAGLLMAVELGSDEQVQRVLQACLKAGLFSDWFLFAADCIRIAPPLTISEEEIDLGCSILLEAMQ